MVTPNETIDHVTLERLIEAGAVRGASIIGQPGGWRVVIQYGMTERALAAKRGAVRIFRKFESLVGYLKGIGIATYQVDATGFDPMPRKTGTREGAATRMKPLPMTPGSASRSNPPWMTHARAFRMRK